MLQRAVTFIASKVINLIANAVNIFLRAKTMTVIAMFSIRRVVVKVMASDKKAHLFF